MDKENTTYFKFKCTHCGKNVEQAGPCDIIFLLEVEKPEPQLSILSHMHNACTQCVKLISAHNKPIEARIAEVEKNLPVWDHGRLLDDNGEEAEVTLISSDGDVSEPVVEGLLNFSPVEKQAAPPPVAPMELMMLQALQSLAEGQKAILDALNKKNENSDSSQS